MHGQFQGCWHIINSRSNEKKIRESNIPYQYFHLFSVAVGRVRPNIKFINSCGSRLIASRQLLHTIFELVVNKDFLYYKNMVLFNSFWSRS